MTLGRTLRPLSLTVFFALAACDGGDVAPDLLHAWTPIAGSAPAGFCTEALERVDSWMAQQVATPFEVPASREGRGERYGGTAVVGSGQELVDGMSAFTYSDYNSNQHHQFVNLMTLIYYDADLNPQPWLAESWEVAEDGTSVTFRLRDDVYWHDGERTDAEDVAFTWAQVTNPETGFPNSAFWDMYETGEGSLEVIDPLTVRIAMQPHADALDPWRSVAIMPEHLLGDVPASELGQHPYATQCPVGNGPFVFREHRLDEQWTFQANPAFPEALGGRPYLDRYVYRVIPEATTRVTEAMTGTLDLLVQVDPGDAARIDEADGVELRDFAFRTVNFIAWNSRRAPFDDVRVRRALTLGLDRDEMVEALLQGYGVVANGTVPPFHWGFNSGMDQADRHDPVAAGALLDEAGWIDRDGDGVRENAAGNPLELTLTYNAGNPQRRDIAEIYQAQLGEIGVQVTPEMLEIPTLVGRVFDPSARDFDGVVFGWVTEFRLDDRNLFASDRLGQPYQFSGLQDGVVDETLAALQEPMERDVARAMWRGYQEALLEAHPFTFLFFPERLDAVSSRMQDVVTDARGEWVNISEWWIAQEDRR